MSLPLIETKLFLPSPRPGLVPRPRLRERLDRGLGAKLMLVSAPAGFGKTTLLVDWMASAAGVARARPSRAGPGWPSTPADNDPARFWRYVVAALRTAVPGVGEDALGAAAGPAATAGGGGADDASSTSWRRPTSTSSCCSTTTT